MRGQTGKPLVVWRLLDGKPGHESQSLGLVQALQRRLGALAIHDIQVTTGWPRTLMEWLFKRFPAAGGLPTPALLIGAGHATHLPLLAARRARGGRAVVLMRPTLPLRLYDLCVVPEHDAVERRPGVLITQGVLNPMTAQGPHREERCLVLIGGPSRHHGWDSRKLIEQIRVITGSAPQRHFTLTTSRRTPDDFWTLARAAGIPNLTLAPFAQTEPGWVAHQLAEAGSAWVSADSVSMVYEALTAGVAVGILEVPVRRAGRVLSALERLVENGSVVRYGQWRAEGVAPLPRGGRFGEAERCAEWMVKQWRLGA
ncbi:MAG: nucleoside-diphosphate sugar epimerase [gamma proteobacterium symbiont of Phacoides pectinatus]